MNYFIADTHFGHESVIKMCGRPFSSVEEMDNCLIENWNRRVKNGDTVYILGDLINKSEHSPEYYLSRLKGKKLLITGNHDASCLGEEKNRSAFFEITQYKEICLCDHMVTLCHYPMLEWRNSRKQGSKKLGYLIHGHIHNKSDTLYRSLYTIGNALNAGADINGFEPVTFEELEINNEAFKLSVLPDLVSKALFLCQKYHMHQSDKAGVFYASHPIYVASQMKSDEEKIVALLHDTLEYTTLLPQVIEREFGKRIFDAVSAITRREGEEYFAYIRRMAGDPIAKAVKTEELKHNMDISRLKKVTEQDIERAKKYRTALTMIETGECGKA